MSLDVAAWTRAPGSTKRSTATPSKGARIHHRLEPVEARAQAVDARRGERDAPRGAAMGRRGVIEVLLGDGGALSQAPAALVDRALQLVLGDRADVLRLGLGELWRSCALPECLLVGRLNEVFRVALVAGGP